MTAGVEHEFAGAGGAGDAGAAEAAIDEVEGLIARLKQVVHGIDQMQIDLVVLAMLKVGDGIRIGGQTFGDALEDELVGSRVAKQLIDAQAASDLVVTGTAANRVVAPGAIDRIVAAATSDRILFAGRLMLSSDGLCRADDVVALRALDGEAVDVADLN